MVKKILFLTSFFLLLKSHAFGQSNVSDNSAVQKVTRTDSAVVAPVFIQAVEQNNPNPFDDRTEIIFSSEDNGIAQFKIYNLIGTAIQEYDIAVKKGINKLVLDARDFDSGIYYYALIHGSNAFTRKMIVKK